jgi:hypothetical protein
MINPGSSATTTLTRTPSASASGTYGYSVASLRLNTSGASGSTTGSVTVASSLSVSAWAAKTGGGYQLSATVMAGTAPAKGVAVKFTVTDPRGSVSTFSGTTTTAGTVSVKDNVKNNAPKGTYKLQVTATGGGLTGTSSATFVVS